MSISFYINSAKVYVSMYLCPSFKIFSFVKEEAFRGTEFCIPGTCMVVIGTLVMASWRLGMGITSRPEARLTFGLTLYLYIYFELMRRTFPILLWCVCVDGRKQHIDPSSSSSAYVHHTCWSTTTSTTLLPVCV